MAEYTPYIEADVKVNDKPIDKGNEAVIEELFNYEKTSPHIEKELEQHNSFFNKEEVQNDSTENDTYSLDDLSNGDYEEEAVEEEVEEVVEDLEEYFESAEFVIFITELVIVWGTNVYLKQNNLDKISIKEFEKTARQQKMLVKSWAKVLRKYGYKIGVEVELLFALGSTYAMKLKMIVEKQELRKEKQRNEKLKRANKNNNTKQKNKGIVNDNNNINTDKNNKKEETFNVDFEAVEEVEEEEIEEVEEEVKEKDKGALELIKK